MEIEQCDLFFEIAFCLLCRPTLADNLPLQMYARAAIAVKKMILITGHHK
jgi:hypothetical protein